MISLELGDKRDLEWAQETVVKHHYLHQRVNNQARPMVYVLRYGDIRAGLIMAGSPHATRNKGWYGYPHLPTQWQVVDLCRIWIDPRFQIGGEACGILAKHAPGFYDRKGAWRSTLASWAIGEVLARIQRDRVSLYPPVFPDQPYHIRLVISYHDPAFHRGFIYRQMGWEPMYTDDKGSPVTAEKSDKFGWCWRLPEPAWEWSEIEIRRPRTMRMSLEFA